MPSCLAEVMKAKDLRLLHASIKIARIKVLDALKKESLSDNYIRQLLAPLRQAEAIAATEMCKANLLPALSAAELRDEMIPDNELPMF